MQNAECSSGCCIQGCRYADMQICKDAGKQQSKAKKIKKEKSEWDMNKGSKKKEWRPIMQKDRTAEEKRKKKKIKKYTMGYKKIKI